MKLIDNVSENNSILSYFEGVDSVNEWTLESPAIFHKIYLFDSSQEYQYVFINEFLNISSQPKYLLIKLDSDIKYEFFIDPEYNGCENYSCKITAFNYFKSNIQDIDNDRNYVFQEIINRNKKTFKFSNPILLLFKISIFNSYSVEKTAKLCVSNPVLEFDYSSHYIRDWQNKVKGNSWDVSGKIKQDLSSLIIERNPNIPYEKADYEGNECDIGKYISLPLVFNNKIVSHYYPDLTEDNIVHIDNDLFQELLREKTQNEFSQLTISLWIKINDFLRNNDVLIFDSNTLCIVIKKQQVLSIKHQSSSFNFDFEFELDKWHHICITMSSSIIACYFDSLKNNYESISQVNYNQDYFLKSQIENSEDNLSETEEIGSIDFQVRKISFYKDMKTQLQVHKIYMNEAEQYA